MSLYPGSSSTSMIHTPVDRNKDFKGPKFFSEILRAIEQDCKQEGRNISCDEINRILYFFFTLFSRQNFKSSFHMEGLGFFKKVERPPHKHPKSKLAMYKMKRKRQAEKNHIKKIAKAKIWYKRFMKFNKLRREKGHREWSWAHFCDVRHITPLKVYRSYVLKSRMKFF